MSIAKDFRNGTSFNKTILVYELKYQKMEIAVTAVTHNETITSLIASLQDQNKSGFFGGPAFIH